MFPTEQLYWNRQSCKLRMS